MEKGFRRKVVRVFVAWVMVLNVGCGTIFMRGPMGATGETVYTATQMSVVSLTIPLSPMGSSGGFGVGEPGIIVRLLMLGLAVVDVPISVVTDTVMLPVDLTILTRDHVIRPIQSRKRKKQLAKEAAEIVRALENDFDLLASKDFRAQYDYESWQKGLSDMIEKDESLSEDQLNLCFENLGGSSLPVLLTHPNCSEEIARKIYLDKKEYRVTDGLRILSRHERFHPLVEDILQNDPEARRAFGYDPDLRRTLLEKGLGTFIPEEEFTQ